MNIISKIAQNTNISQATVSKVLNHRHGVSSAMRQMVFAEYDRIGIKKKEESVAVYVILPEIPQYFWTGDFPTLTAEGLRVKYNIYSRIGDDAIVLRYLHQAIELEAQVLVIAARINEEMRSLIDRFSEKGFVIFLTEHNLSRNSVYIGSDSAEDGRQLARLLLRHVGPDDRLLVIHNKNETWGETSKLRETAFYEEVGDTVDYAACYVDFSTDTDLLPSQIARNLSPLLFCRKYTRVVCLNGFTHLLCKAIHKVGYAHSLCCFGFEDNPQNNKFVEMGLLRGIVNQDFQTQFGTALRLATDFCLTGQRPSSSEIIIPSILLEY